MLNKTRLGAGFFTLLLTILGSIAFAADQQPDCKTGKIINIPGYRFQTFAADTEAPIQVPFGAQVVVEPKELAPTSRTIHLKLTRSKTEVGLFTSEAIQIPINTCRGQEEYVQEVIFLFNTTLTGGHDDVHQYPPRWIFIKPSEKTGEFPVYGTLPVLLIPDGTILGTFEKNNYSKDYDFAVFEVNYYHMPTKEKVESISGEMDKAIPEAEAKGGQYLIWGRRSRTAGDFIADRIQPVHIQSAPAELKQ